MTGIAGAEANAPAVVLAGLCFACGREMPDGVPFAVRVAPGFGMIRAGSKACAESPRFRHAFIAEVWPG